MIDIFIDSVKDVDSDQFSIVFSPYRKSYQVCFVGFKVWVLGSLKFQFSFAFGFRFGFGFRFWFGFGFSYGFGFVVKFEFVFAFRFKFGFVCDFESWVQVWV